VKGRNRISHFTYHELQEPILVAGRLILDVGQVYFEKRETRDEEQVFSSPFTFHLSHFTLVISLDNASKLLVYNRITVGA